MRWRRTASAVSTRAWTTISPSRSRSKSSRSSSITTLRKTSPERTARSLGTSLAVLLAPLVLAACGARSDSRSDSDLEDEPAAPTAPAARFAAEEGGAADVGSVRLRVIDAGPLTLPSGELGASDAFIDADPVLALELPHGEHRVEL